ncbi:G-type lectin S-receptor-like serine/threonine-protein kinase [Tanacetum coccineum]
MDDDDDELPSAKSKCRLFFLTKARLCHGGLDYIHNGFMKRTRNARIFQEARRPWDNYSKGMLKFMKRNARIFQEARRPGKLLKRNATISVDSQVAAVCCGRLRSFSISIDIGIDIGISIGIGIGILASALASIFVLALALVFWFCIGVGNGDVIVLTNPTMSQPLRLLSLEGYINRTMSPSECEAICLKNRTCMAYASTYIRVGGSGCVLWFNDLIDIRVLSEGKGGDNIKMMLDGVTPQLLAEKLLHGLNETQFNSLCDGFSDVGLVGVGVGWLATQDNARWSYTIAYCNEKLLPGLNEAHFHSLCDGFSKRFLHLVDSRIVKVTVSSLLTSQQSAPEAARYQI